MVFQCVLVPRNPNPIMNTLSSKGRTVRQSRKDLSAEIFDHSVWYKDQNDSMLISGMLLPLNKVWQQEE